MLCSTFLSYRTDHVLYYVPPLFSQTEWHTALIFIEKWHVALSSPDMETDMK